MNINKIWSRGRAICPFLFTLIIASCQPEKEWTRLQGNALGTTYNVQFEKLNQDITTVHIDSVLGYFDHALSTYNAESYLTALNERNWDYVMNHLNSPYVQSDTSWLGVMVRSSIAMYTSTGGAFDPSVGLLFDLWSDAKKKQSQPSDSQVNWALSHRGFSDAVLNNWKLAFIEDSLSAYNFNAIAKGYAVDVVAAYLDNENVEQYMVEIGGEVRVKGHNPEGTNWRLGINQPVIGSESTSIFEVIELEHGSMATSGNYRNYFVVDKDTIGHTLDPRTGFPVNNPIKSATVLHKECHIADALATACMVLGVEQGKELIEKDSSARAYFIYQESDSLVGEYID
ncbi:MAG: FAD:protein FMN transferase [Bacteroidia bacterium]